MRGNRSLEAKERFPRTPSEKADWVGEGGRKTAGFSAGGACGGLRSGSSAQALHIVYGQPLRQPKAAARNVPAKGAIFLFFYEKRLLFSCLFRFRLLFFPGHAMIIPAIRI